MDSKRMGYGRVLLVSPHFAGEWGGIRPHLGLAYISEYLKYHGIEHKLLDMNLGYKFHHLQKLIEDFRPDLIGMTMISLQHKRSYKFLERIKSANPDIKIIAGGCHVSILKEQVLNDCQAIDYGVVFEGEQTLVELCQGTKEPEDISGLLIRRDGEIVYTGDRLFERDLDKYPFPKYEQFELNRYQKEKTIYSSRGCPHLCIFCPNRMISPVFRARSADNVADEIEYWYRRGFRQFNFDDDNFNYIRERVFKLCDEIEKRDLKRLYLKCSNGIRADRVDRDMLARMKEVGFKAIAFGADAGNDKMLKLVKKGESIKDIDNACRIACELGYETKILFVVGNPGETLEDIEDDVKLTKKYPFYDAHFYNIIPYPGTELFEWIKNHHYFLIEPDVYLNTVSDLANRPVFETPELPAETRKKVFRYLNKVKKDVHRNALKRILKKYGIFGKIGSLVLIYPLFERLFFQNVFFRNLVERFRYKRALGE